MMTELAGEEVPVEIRILGVNRRGSEAGNAGMTAGRSLPWVQDDAEALVWSRWNAAWRDVVILDTRSARMHVYNLTEHRLSVSENYAALKAMLLDAARR
jgi:hypothetical protein